MSGDWILLLGVFALAAIVLALQAFVAARYERRRQRIEERRGAEAKVLLEFLGMAWWAKR